MTTRQLRTILYVEDDADIRTIARLALEAVGGYAVTMCPSGGDALEAVEAGAAPDLILLDVMIPGMDGPATLAALRKLPRTAGTPVIFMTAKSQSDEIAYYKSLGATGVIAKPFNPMELARQVRSLWDEGSAQP